MKRMLLAVLIAGSGLTALAGEVPYPSGYRGWWHVKSMVIEEGHPLYASFGGIHHIYANKKALEGYKSGRFPDGSVIVFDLLQAKREGNAVVEGARKVVGVMHKHAKRYAATGGWGFEGFAGDSTTERLVKDNAKGACFDCHASQHAFDYVFSRLRDGP